MSRYLTAIIVLSIALLSNCIYKSTAQKIDTNTPPGVTVSIGDNVISVNGETILKHPMFNSRTLAQLSGSEQGQEELVVILDSLRKKEYPEAGKSHKKKPVALVNAQLYTQYVTAYNSIAACEKSKFESVRLSVSNHKEQDGEISLVPPDSADPCTQMTCRVERFSVKLVAGADTIFQIPYRTAYRYRTPSKPKGIITQEGPLSEAPPRDPKTGQYLSWKECVEIMLYRSDDTLNIPLTDEVTRELLQYRNGRNACAKTPVLSIGAPSDVSIGIVSQVIRAVHTARYLAVSLRPLH